MVQKDAELKELQNQINEEIHEHDLTEKELQELLKEKEDWDLNLNTLKSEFETYKKTNTSEKTTLEKELKAV